MKIKANLLSLLVGIQLLTVSSAFSAADTYQVTGPIIVMNEKVIVVQKGKERWELARDQMTKIKGELKVGDKVTIRYRMMATVVEKKEPDTKDISSRK